MSPGFGGVAGCGHRLGALALWREGGGCAGKGLLGEMTPEFNLERETEEDREEKGSFRPSEVQRKDGQHTSKHN